MKKATQNQRETKSLLYIPLSVESQWSTIFLLNNQKTLLQLPSYICENRRGKKNSELHSERVRTSIDSKKLARSCWKNKSILKSWIFELKPWCHSNRIRPERTTLQNRLKASLSFIWNKLKCSWKNCAINHINKKKVIVTFWAFIT